MRSPFLPFATALVLAAGACTVGPNYKRPPVEAPTAFRGATPAQPAAPASVGDAHWWEVFQDQTLQGLIKTALEHNHDIQMAAARILEAQAQLGVTRADQFPTVSAGVDVLSQKFPAVLFKAPPIEAIEATGTINWEMDFWGQYRRATEAARAALVASAWGQRAVANTLVSQVASAYFGLRALDLELDIAERTLASRRQSLQLTQVREQGGVASLVDVRQAEQLVYAATSEIATLQREIEQQENFISELLGNNPGAVPRGRALTDQPHAPEVPAGLPSALLARRPDIQEAEQQIVAANAQIGIARAAYFPQIALTGNGGWESKALTALFSPATAIWTVTAGATEPIFTAGRTKSQVAIATARRQEATVGYERAVQHAFREVSDALVGYRKDREFREQQALLFASARDARALAQTRYEGGVTSYLEVLDADTRQFDAEIGLAQAQLAELNALVEIYRALGGGWQ